MPSTPRRTATSSTTTVSTRPEGAQGHGIFGQNKTGVRRITDNIVFGQFGSGIRAYASDEGFLDDIQLEGNVATNNGIVGGDFSILLGGQRIAKRPVLKANYVYDNPGAGINLGYGAGCADPVMSDNYFSVMCGGYAMQLVNCSGGLQRNVLIGATRGHRRPDHRDAARTGSAVSRQ